MLRLWCFLGLPPQLFTYVGRYVSTLFLRTQHTGGLRSAWLLAITERKRAIRHSFGLQVGMMHALICESFRLIGHGRLCDCSSLPYLESELSFMPRNT